MPLGPRKPDDLTGRRFGRLVVLERAPNTKRGVVWLCQCDCGNKKVVPGQDLKGKTKSCGCYARDYQRERIKQEEWGAGPWETNGCANYQITYRGKTQGLRDWCKELAPEMGTSVKRFFSACSNRYTKGLRGPELLRPTMVYYKKKYEIPDPQFDVNKDPEEQMKAK